MTASILSSYHFLTRSLMLTFLLDAVVAGNTAKCNFCGSRPEAAEFQQVRRAESRPKTLHTKRVVPLPVCAAVALSFSILSPWPEINLT